jgi:hypothetical protein
MAVVLAAGAVSAQTTRLSDRDVKALMQAVDQSRDRFEDALDGTLKRSVIRGPKGEVDVARFLDDLQENVKGLPDRFKPDYAASNEVLTVLRQGTDIEGFVRRQPPTFKGRSEWDRLAGDLGKLAAAYGTEFPLPPDAGARRTNDGEVAKTAEQIATNANTFAKTAKDAMKRAKADKAAIDAVDRDAKALANAAKSLKSRISGGKPATAEAQQVLELAGPLRDVAAGNNMMPAIAPLLGNLEKLRQAFGMPAGEAAAK